MHNGTSIDSNFGLNQFGNKKKYTTSIGSGTGNGSAVRVVPIDFNNTRGSPMWPGALFCIVQRNGDVFGDNNCHFEVKIS